MEVISMGRVGALMLYRVLRNHLVRMAFRERERVSKTSASRGSAISTF